MEVMPGFKQTDAGLVPEQWDVRRISDFATVGSGGTPSRAVSAYWNGSIPWITTSQIDFGVIDSADQFITADGLKSSAAKLLPAGTLVMAMYGQGKTRGKVGVLGMPAATNQACASITLHDGVSREYVFHYLSSKYEEIRSSSNSGSQDNLSGHIVRQIPIALPGLAEQRAIAAALSGMDALLAGLDRLIAKKRDLKQAAMQQLLTGQTRLPGFQGEWVMNRLSDTASLKARIGWQGLTTAEYLDSGAFYLVTGTEFQTGYIEWSRCHFVDEVRYKQDTNIQLRPRDVLVTKDGTIGKVALVPSLPGPATLNSGVFVIRPLRNSFHPEFFYYVLCSRQFSDFLSQLAAGSTISHLYQKDFVSFAYRAPASLEEQAAIAKILAEMDAELTTLEARRDKTRALKQGMMQELLTGRTRLV